MKVPGAILAGITAFLGGFFGKLSGAEITNNVEISIVLKIVFIILMVSVNTLSLTIFVKALQATSTLKVTLISSGTNFLLSGISGVLLFGETSSVWLISGYLCLLIGLYLTQFNNNQEQKLD